MKDTYKPYKMKVDPNVRKAIDAVMRDLTNTGRAVTDGNNARRLSRTFRDWAKDEKLYFGNCHKHSKSLIIVKPGYELKKLKNGRVLLKYKKF